MAEAPARRGGRAVRLEVLRKETLTPHMIRIVAGGEGLRDFRPNEFTDAYVKVIFKVPGVEYPEPFDMQRVREELPREHAPRMRTYTVRSYDAAAGELVLDFVVHGDEGLAGPWAQRAQPGDELLLAGPGGAYAPRADAGWHLLAGDESALPAIAAAVEALPAGVPAQVFLLVEDAAEEQALVTKADVHVTWLHRSAGGDLASAVRSAPWRSDDVHAFVHGEAGFVRDLRRYLFTEREVARERVSVSGYWREGKDDEAWREEKAAERTAAGPA
ncbi:siderophore-interacting protein [Amycolatopsis jiangsuensis]|uniref:NADPH-dependent ferric siderophore reductase n=1 Tax=Amycolatopsis jiangsuensis TaxID=1181879 RepID=A0A840IME3_9PSEU|nr:siderophore-interacting protein [Amycolatopsis jiangsuensis]MBB4682547.1 NADPH-dependent ferric siderophore reductase [Amycolatopsis jiangsuensis]